MWHVGKIQSNCDQRKFLRITNSSSHETQQSWFRFSVTRFESKNV